MLIGEIFMLLLKLLSQLELPKMQQLETILTLLLNGVASKILMNTTLFLKNVSFSRPPPIIKKKLKNGLLL